MKTLLRKSNNSPFDNLLRSHFRRPVESDSVCSEFDPDRANAYIERGLGGVERARYERHLSGCSGCRTSVVALARMADAELGASPVPNTVPNSELSELGWLASLKTGLWVIASPRWAVVASALLVISISVVVLRNGQPGRSVNERAAPAAAETPSADDSASGMFDSSRAQSASPAAPSRSAQKIAAGSLTVEREAARRENFSPGDLKKADETTPAATGTQASADALERRSVEVGRVAGSRDDARLKENNERETAGAAAPPASQPKSEETKALAKIPKDTVLKLPPEDTRSAKVETLKQGAPDGGLKTERDKETISAIRSSDGDAPKHKAVLEPESRTRIASGARGRALVGGEGASHDRAHSPERTVGKKTFWLSRGVWTDSEYNSDRKLPVVTIVRDSDVYKEMLEKNNKLKVFFKGFTETERAIIVFKNTVYNLIPQSDNK